MDVRWASLSPVLTLLSTWDCLVVIIWKPDIIRNVWRYLAAPGTNADPGPAAPDCHECAG